jgi:lysophospholipase L1-like esterase
VKQLSATFVFALVAACGLAAVAAETAAPSAPSTAAKPKAAKRAAKLGRFTAEIAAFEAWDRKNSPPKNAVLFVGSSSIRLWQTAEAFPELAVINRGFGGSEVSDVNHYAERIVVKYAPRTIVFYAGDNDIAAGKKPERIAEAFAEFAEAMHEKLPEARIIYLPIKPSVARWKLWPKAQDANALAKQFIQEHDYVAYIDIATPMLGSDGQPRPEIFLDDGLHMNEVGYRIWNEALARQFAQ